MKKVTFILLLTLGTASITKAQFINKLKEKTKAAATTSVDRSTDKVVDKAVNKTADNATDKALNKTGEKLGKLFKKKNKKAADTVQPVTASSDSTTVAPSNQRR